MNETLESAAQKVKELRDQAQRLQKEHMTREHEIDDDADLSDEGKRRLHEDNYRTVKSALNGLRETEMSTLKDTQTILERRLDGWIGYTSADVIAFRDAHDRAEALDDPEAAQRVLARAMRNNDRTLALAVFQRAIEQGWGSVKKQFAAENPDLAEAADAVENARRAQAPNFNRALAYGLASEYRPVSHGMSVRLSGWED